MMKLFQTLDAKCHLEQLERSEGASKSSALLLTILVVGLISIVSLSVSRLSISEIKMAGGANESAAAYFAAEAGLEDGLARWRWNRNVEVPTGATETSTETFDSGDLGNGASYKLKIWYKKDTAGNFNNVDDQDNPVLTKDSAWEFDVEGLTQIRLKYRITKDYTSAAFPSSGIQHGVEVSQSNKVDNTWTTNFYDQNSDNDASDTDGILIAISANAKLIRIKPWDADIKFAIKPISPTNSKIDSGTHYIESTGYYKNTKRKLVAKIDRKSGTILSVYDFVIYAGSTLTNQ